jgi:hypothetical protein
MKPFKSYFFTILLYVSVFTANAQKLPGIQSVSLRIPAGSKIDGKSTEWNNVFQAYNKSTNIYYTLANGDDNLYLAVQVTDPLIIRKIINGGITLTVNNGAAITYPVFTKTNRPFINLNDKPAHSKDPTLDKKLLDSFVYVINKRFADKSKEIKVQGVQSITDSLISIYNENGIKAAVLFDDKAVYNYELAVPLKYWGIATSGLTKFKYTITLNGSSQVDGVTITQMQVTIGPGAPSIPTASDSAILTSPTNLTGEYTLAVK